MMLPEPQAFLDSVSTALTQSATLVVARSPAIRSVELREGPTREGAGAATSGGARRRGKR